MRVLFCDPLNTQNNFYIFAKYLRQKGIDASLVIDSGGSIPEGNLPEWHDVFLKAQKSPRWLHRLKFPFVLPYLHPLEYLRRWISLVDLAKKHDLVVCSGITPIWIHWARKPFIFVSYGSDLDQEATQGWSGIPRRSITLYQKIVHFVAKRQLVWSLRKASAVMLSPYQIETAHCLGLSNLRFLPHMIDTELFSPMDYQQRQCEKEKMRKELGCDLILFHPPRQVWVDRLITDCKGNDKVFRAFAKFVGVSKKRVKLVVVEKGWDVEESKNLVNKLGISEHVVWMEPMPKPKMCRFYNMADIVLDQFVVGVFALVSVEAMACGTPVLTYVAQAPDGMFYSEMPPIVNVHRERDIYRKMCLLAEKRDMRDKLGREGQQWVEKYCQPDVAVQKYVELFKGVLGHIDNQTP